MEPFERFWRDQEQFGKGMMVAVPGPPSILYSKFGFITDLDIKEGKDYFNQQYRSNLSRWKNRKLFYYNIRKFWNVFGF